MDRRTYEGPMDWEYQHAPPVDHTSPFAKLSQRNQHPSIFSPFQTPQSQRLARPAATAASSTPNVFPSSSFKQPPHSQFFQPQLSRQPSAPTFRNPAFTTPQRRVADAALVSDYSGGPESSPAPTDHSDAPTETPDYESRWTGRRRRSDDSANDHHDGDDDGDENSFAKMTVTQHSAGRVLFGRHTPGRGEVARGQRDKVRKRRRAPTDRDVGSVRPRLPHGSDESDSDWDGDAAGASRWWGRSGQGGKKATLGQQPAGGGGGIVGNFLSAVSNHPNAPALLSRWLQLGINILVVCVVLGCAVFFLNQIRADLADANETARLELTAKVFKCRENWEKNRCDPREGRLPALELQCDAWQVCMAQDTTGVRRLQLSARNMAEVINEFVGVLTVKTWGFIMSFVVITLVASNIGFGLLRESAIAAEAKPAATPAPSQPAAHHHPMLGSSLPADARQAYIWAPIGGTPRHVRRALFEDDATDTDNSPPAPPKALMAPRTPSGRKSPSKAGDREGDSPSKGSRSPSKRLLLR